MVRTRRKELVNCETCGNAFYKQTDKIKRSAHHFCNRKCYGVWLSKYHLSQRPVHTCENCGQEFSKAKCFLKGNHVFCRPECYSQWQAKGGDLIDLSPLTPKQIEIITGSLLGDGFLVKTYPEKRHLNSGFGKRQKKGREDYLYWHQEELLPYSRLKLDYASNPKPIKIGDKIGRHESEICESRVYTTYRHHIFTEMRQLWYPDGKKLVPRHIQLTPLTVTVWFCDDGSNTSSRHRSAVFCTNCFTLDDVEFLIAGLSSLNIKSYPQPKGKDGQYEIKVRACSYKDLIDMITPYVTWPSMQHKIDLSSYTPARKAQSGVVGVYKSRRAWIAIKQKNGIRYNLGRYRTKEEAAVAVAEFESRFVDSQ